MRLPDYAESRRRAGVARAQEMRRLAVLLRRFVRRAARSIHRGRRAMALYPAHGLRPVPVRARRWPAPYDISQDRIH